jgi:hypothetical protein
MLRDTNFSKYIGVFKAIRNEIDKTFNKVMSKKSYYEKAFHEKITGFIRQEIIYSDVYFKKEYNKYKQDIIKTYMDISYKVLKKYKKDLEQISKEVVEDYDEALCYNYKVEKFIIIPNQNKSREDISKIDLKDYGVDPSLVTFVNTHKEAEKILKQYQKKARNEI